MNKRQGSHPRQRIARAKARQHNEACGEWAAKISHCLLWLVWNMMGH